MYNPLNQHFSCYLWNGTNNFLDLSSNPVKATTSSSVIATLRFVTVYDMHFFVSPEEFTVLYAGEVLTTSI